MYRPVPSPAAVPEREPWLGNRFLLGRVGPCVEGIAPGGHAVDLVGAAGTVGLEVAGRVLGRCRVGDHPAQDGVGITVDEACRDVGLEALGGCRQAREALADLEHVEPVRLEARRQPGRVPAIDAQTADPDVVRDDVGSDALLVDPVAGREADPASGGPGIVGDVVAADAGGKIDVELTANAARVDARDPRRPPAEQRSPPSRRASAPCSAVTGSCQKQNVESRTGPVPQLDPKAAAAAAPSRQPRVDHLGAAATFATRAPQAAHVGRSAAHRPTFSPLGR